jgi:thiosulfate/3-mercaptopyruvate sulfurtransferase
MEKLMQPVVDVAWLAAHREAVVLADVRWYLDGRSGRAAYEAGHAPGAVFIDLDEWLAGPGSPAKGRHPLPDSAVFARGMATHGISDDSMVIAYDDAGGVIAARLIWMLRATGHAAALLDGGLASFTGDLEAGPGASPALGVFSSRDWPAQRLATIEDATDRSRVVLDARNRDRYEGAPDAVDPRFGHIPGARSVPCRENLDVDGRLKVPAEIRAAFEAAGVGDDTDVISYCGSGVTACHNLLTMEWAGLGLGRLFPGSWSQYSSDESRPLATGAAPG